jgi:hypothetical protein
MSWSAEKVYPCDCTFLLTIPTNRDEFCADLRDKEKDFLHAHYRDSRLSDDAKWRTYKPTADDMNALIHWLRRKNVRVIARATLADWRRAQEISKVIILFAHWRSGIIRPEEVRWTELDTSVLQSRTEDAVVECVRRTVVEAKGDQAKVVKGLNHILLNGQLGPHPWFGKGLNQIPASPEHRAYINRKFLDEALPNAFGRNTCVEFADGLTGIETIASNAMRSFNGVFDLSVCNSILLGELIKGYASDCLTAATRLPAMVDFRIIFYRALFKLLKQGRHYVSTLKELRERLVQCLEASE